MRYLTVLFWCLCFSLNANADKEIYPESIIIDIDNHIIERWQRNEPGGGVVIIENGEIIYENYRGLSNIQQKTLFTDDTIIQYASVTKRFTAAAILKLVAKNKLKLDKKIGQYLPSLDKKFNKITVRHLLTHSSGIPSLFEGDSSYNYSTKENLEQINTLGLQFEPGTNSSYSNNGYTVLGAILEQQTGKAWHEVIKEYIAPTKNYKSIQYLGDYLNSNNLPAVGYYEEHDGYPIAHMKSPGILHANGGLAGTTKDLALWVYAFHNSDILSPAMLTIAHEKQALPNGNIGWAAGMFRFNYKGVDVVGHDGSVSGTNAYTLYIPKNDRVIVTASNTPHDARHLAFKVLSHFLKKPIKNFKHHVFDSEQLQANFGAYKYNNGNFDHFFMKDESLFIKRGDQTPDRLLYAGNDIYFFKRRNHWFQIITDTAGKKTMAFHRFGNAKAIEANKFSR